MVCAKHAPAAFALAVVTTVCAIAAGFVFGWGASVLTLVPVAVGLSYAYSVRRAAANDFDSSSDEISAAQSCEEVEDGRVRRNSSRKNSKSGSEQGRAATSANSPSESEVQKRIKRQRRKLSLLISGDLPNEAPLVTPREVSVSSIASSGHASSQGDDEQHLGLRSAPAAMAHQQQQQSVFSRRASLPTVYVYDGAKQASAKGAAEGEEGETTGDGAAAEDETDAVEDFAASPPRRKDRRLSLPETSFPSPGPASDEQMLASMADHSRLELRISDLRQTTADADVESVLRIHTKAREQAQREQRKADRLLNSMVPAVIAKQLKDGKRIIADRYEEVTVLFTDIVGFTKLCNHMNAVETVMMMNEMFSVFDDICEDRQLHKVETIGDSYMLVGGAPSTTTDHAEQVSLAAIEMIINIPHLRELTNMPSLNIRVGIHTGEVVAGVVGYTNPRWHLFGDTVNTASRMESNGVEGKIQISEAVRARIEPFLEVTCRGNLHIKGLGEMTTFLVATEGRNLEALARKPAATGDYEGSPAPVALELTRQSF